MVRVPVDPMSQRLQTQTRTYLPAPHYADLPQCNKSGCFCTKEMKKIE